MTSRLLAYRPEMELPEGPGTLPLQQEDELALAAQLLEVPAPARFDAFLGRQLAAWRPGGSCAARRWNCRCASC
jgi:hypothetical protein